MVEAARMRSLSVVCLCGQTQSLNLRPSLLLLRLLGSPLMLQDDLLVFMRKLGQVIRFAVETLTFKKFFPLFFSHFDHMS